MSEAGHQEKVEAKGSYRRILAATSMIGGATAVNMAVGMVRAKVVALLLGKAGMGVMGMYMSISGLATSVVSMGLNFSGVKELAAAHGSGDQERLDQTLHTFWRLTLLLAFVGSLGLVLAAWPVSWSSFGNADHVWPVALLSLTIAGNLLTNYYVAVVQAAGQVSRVAGYYMISGVAGAAVSILCFWLWQREGIITSLVAGAAVQAGLAWWLARGVEFMKRRSGASFSKPIARSLIQIGGLVVGIGLLTSLGAVLVRSLIIRNQGEEGAGLYQAAFGLSGMFANYILGAMGTDLLPRLSAASNDHTLMGRLINEQTKVGLLLALPGAVGTIVAAPIVIPLFYARDFSQAVPLLQLMVVAMMGRVLAFPLGFALIAIGAVRRSLISEIVSHCTQLSLLFLLLPLLGVMASGWASIGMYVMCPLLLIYLTRREIGFCWSADILWLLPLSMLAMAAAVASSWLLHGAVSIVLGVLVVLATSVLCLRSLIASAEISMSGVAGRIKAWFTPRKPAADSGPDIKP